MVPILYWVPHEIHIDIGPGCWGGGGKNITLSGYTKLDDQTEVGLAQSKSIKTGS